MTTWGALAGGFVGALVLVVAIDGAAWARLTRFDVPLALGSAAFDRRVPARAAGYGLHLLFGLGFAAVYAAAGVRGWGEGALAGGVHGALAVTLLFPVLLALVHPRMALGLVRGSALVEAPGPLLVSYGRWTAPLVLALHVVYGTLVGGFAALAG
jgi:hypothetical protein